MTDRLKGVIVTFEQDIRDDDAEPMLAAIRMIKGVAGVSPLVSTSEDLMARTRVRCELSGELSDLIHRVLGP
jgi:hypothetical protein